jgi:DNA-directed RNA polymerase beta' subunit
MSLYKELSYDHDFDTIKGIQFCIMSPDDILDRSVAEITKTDTYNANNPVINGLFDPRMGVIDYNDVCVTCHQKNTFCPGHFGHIKLGKPVFYVQFFDIVLKVLKCVCFKCSKLLIDPESPEVKSILNKKLSRQKKWEAIYKLCSKTKKKCGQFTNDGCDAKIPNVTKEGMLKISMEWKDVLDEETGEKTTKKQILNAEDVLKILRRISNRDAEILGFSKNYNRPEWMVCTIMPVPPPSVRPSVKTDGGMRQEDDLTSKLSMIVKVNNNLKTRIEKGGEKTGNDQIEMLTMLLQYEVATMIDNTNKDIPQSQQRTGRPIRSLTERLKSKEGRIRGNLMGKRVDFSARSVITPDPNISIDELGVPIKIAMNLTFPEIVNKYNKEEMYKIVRNGPDIYPGAKFIRKLNDGVTKRLKTMDRNSIILEDGDVIDRHLKDGDVVLFNRQPSLHRMSMMGHRIRVMPYQTFRLNVCVTPSFNADFDGDEMNMHVPQSLITSEELYQLASVPTQIISPRECKPIVSIVQDIVSGLYRMTQDEVRVTEKQLWNLLSLNPAFCGNLPKPKIVNGKIIKWTGRQLFSTILPANVNVNIKTDDYNDDFTLEENKKKNHVVSIVNGEMKSGIISKDIYQSQTKGIIHQVYNEYGPDQTRILFDNTQKIVCDWLILDGFSVGVSDMIMNKETNKNVDDIIRQMKVNVYDILHKIHEGTFENNSIKNNHEWFESGVNTSLNRAIEDVGKNVKGQINEKSNRLINMIKSKAKGNNINVAQMMGCVGQQNVDGKRIPYGFDDRTLPHYTKYDDGPESRGFVENSFIDGLTPQEFFFHAMGGREGLIDTAVNSVTWETPIIIIENGVTKYVKIGEWIDNKIENDKDSVKYFENQNRMEFLELYKSQVFIPTCDKNGFITWGELTAVTRHDPGKQLYKVTTQSGKSVIVTESKALLVYREGTFKPIPTCDVTLDDYVPSTFNLQDAPIIHDEFCMKSMFNKDDYIHGNELNNAMEIVSLMIVCNESVTREWWNKNCKQFHLPSKCFDIITQLSHTISPSYIKSDCIYTFEKTDKNEFNISMNDSIMSKFNLSKENGEFIGILLVYSTIIDNMLQIKCSEDDVNTIIHTWLAKYNFKYTIKYNTSSKIFKYTVESKLLLEFVKQFIGLGEEIHVPDIAFTSDNNFAIGVIDGYIKSSGISICEEYVKFVSKKYRVLEGISMLLTRMSIFSSIEEQHGCFTLKIGRDYLDKLNIIDLPSTNTLSKKQLMVSRFSCSIISKNDVILDKIISIEKVSIEKYPKVYDVTVPSTLNFCIANGLGIVDTSETGYIQRKLVKAMEDCIIKHDMTVRNANGCIVQFLYGEDGMDPCKIESHTLDYVDITVEEVYEKYTLHLEELKQVLNNEVYDSLEKNSEFKTEIDNHVKQILEDRYHVIVNINGGTCNSKFMYPIGFQRILTIAKNMAIKHNSNKELDLDPLYILTVINKLAKELYVTKCQNGNKLFGILVRTFLSPKKILCQYRLNRASFDFTIQQIKFKFYDSLAHPCEMVGVIAAQSIGEPSTQLTLNSFHGAGISDASKAVRGVPRLNEILSVTKNIKTPVMRIFLDEKARSDKDKCISIMNDIRTIRFKDIISNTKIYFDPDNLKTTVKDDEKLVEFYNEFAKFDSNNIESPWILRLEFDRTKMHHFNLDMITLYNVLDNFYDNKINCMFSDDNSKQLIFRIKLEASDKSSSDDLLTDLKALEHNIMETLVIKGIKNIERASLSEVKSKLYNPISESFYTTSEWVIYTAGTSLRDILCFDIIDSAKTITNDINEVYEVLGVEAARQAIYNEISDVLESVYVNFRHVALLIDVMTNKGSILSVNRHGINRGDIGPLAKCSFEETTDKLIKAGIFAEYDKINGVAANVMLGQIPPCGTGDVELLIDEDMLMDTINENDIDDNDNNSDIDDELCTEENFTINYRVRKNGVHLNEKLNNELIII